MVTPVAVFGTQPAFLCLPRPEHGTRMGRKWRSLPENVGQTEGDTIGALGWSGPR
jgi:hypothetical protein